MAVPSPQLATGYDYAPNVFARSVGESGTSTLGHGRGVDARRFLSGRSGVFRG